MVLRNVVFWPYANVSEEHITFIFSREDWKRLCQPDYTYLACTMNGIDEILDEGPKMAVE